MTSIMDGMVSKKRMVDGKPTSLCDLGYCDVGLDDNWQECGAYGSDKNTFHNEAGFPVVNKKVFPNFIEMTDYAHSKGLTAGWYLNNCICSDHCEDEKCYAGDAAALFEFGFDAVKLDGCSKQLDLDIWANLFNATGKAIMIENCHWGNTLPNATWCPWNFYRTSGDISASFGSVIYNLMTVPPLADAGLSKPGCWAYPDMLEVGCDHGPHGAGDPGLNEFETRTHFAAWCIVSSPLTLSHDINNDATMDKVWPVIANPESIAVNQAYFGHSGSTFKPSNDVGSNLYFYKRMSQDGSSVAVLLINTHDAAIDMVLNFKDIPGLTCATTGTCHVRNIFTRSDVGVFSGSYSAAQIASHDSAFLMISNKVEALY
jgi:hypothetical protein